MNCKPKYAILNIFNVIVDIFYTYSYAYLIEIFLKRLEAIVLDLGIRFSAIALNSSAIIIHNRWISGASSWASQRGPIWKIRGVSGSLCAETAESAGAYMQSLRSERGATPPQKKTYLFVKTLFELERCSIVMIIYANYLYSRDCCSLFSVMLMGPLKSMGPGVITPPLWGPGSVIYIYIFILSVRCWSRDKPRNGRPYSDWVYIYYIYGWVEV